MKTLFHRVSIRKYQNRPVEREHIIEILRAGMQAPSATNQQPWEFYVVEDRAMIKALSESSPYAGCVAGAPVVIVAAYRTDCRVPVYAHIDMSIAMENIWLATDALGLGGVWIGTAPLEERLAFPTTNAPSPSFLWAIRQKPRTSKTVLTKAAFIGLTQSERRIGLPQRGLSTLCPCGY